MQESTDSVQFPSNYQWHFSQNYNRKILKFVQKHKKGPEYPKQS